MQLQSATSSTRPIRAGARHRAGRPRGSAQCAPRRTAAHEAHLRRRHRRHQGRGARLSGRARLRDAGARRCIVDVGTRAPTVAVDVSAAEVAGIIRRARRVLGGDDRGTAVAGMGDAFAASSQSRDDVAGDHRHRRRRRHLDRHRRHARAAARPAKLMVSTLASGDVAPYVGVSDIVDDAGGHRLRRPQPHQPRRAANAAAGDRRHGAQPGAAADGKPAIGLTMFGVTTPCVTADRRAAAATTTTAWSSTPPAPAAGRMEKLADSGLLVRRHRHHHDRGLRPAVRRRAAGRRRTGFDAHRPHRHALCRLGRRARHGQLLGAARRCRSAIADRLFYEHNPNVTLMRTTADECRAIGAWIGRQAQRLRRAGALPHPGKGRLGARHRGRRRSSIRRPTPRCSTPSSARRRLRRRPPAHPPAAPHQRSRLRRRRWSRPSARSPTGEPDMPAIPRADILAEFRDDGRRRRSRSSAAAPAPASRRSAEEAGGIDLIIIYNSGRYRMAGRGSAAGLLAYGNANEIVKEMAHEVLPVVKHTPVLAGVNGTDPVRADAAVPRRAEGDGLFRRAEFPDHRPVRRHHAAELRGDRHGLRARGRHDRRGARARPADHALCLQPRRGARR